MAGLGIGAGAFEGDSEREKLALERRSQNIRLREQDMSADMAQKNAQESARRFDLERQDRQDEIDRTQSNLDRSADFQQQQADRAQGNADRSFGFQNQQADRNAAFQQQQADRRYLLQSQQADRSYDLQNRQSQWADALNAQKYEQSRAQFGAWQDAYDKEQEQLKNRQEISRGVMGNLLMSLLNMPSGQNFATPAITQMVRSNQGWEGFNGAVLGTDDSGNLSCTIEMKDDSGKLSQVTMNPQQMYTVVSDRFGEQTAGRYFPSISAARKAQAEISESAGYKQMLDYRKSLQSQYETETDEGKKKALGDSIDALTKKLNGYFGIADSSVQKPGPFNVQATGNREMAQNQAKAQKTPHTAQGISAMIEATPKDSEDRKFYESVWKETSDAMNERAGKALSRENYEKDKSLSQSFWEDFVQRAVKKRREMSDTGVQKSSSVSPKNVDDGSSSSGSVPSEDSKKTVKGVEEPASRTARGDDRYDENGKLLPVSQEEMDAAKALGYDKYKDVEQHDLLGKKRMVRMWSGKGKGFGEWHDVNPKKLYALREDELARRYANKNKDWDWWSMRPKKGYLERYREARAKDPEMDKDAFKKLF